ncbi:MAG: hypothetical protein WCJ72_01555 [Chryseobacterium sp.]
MFKEQESNEMLGIGNEVVKFIGKDSDDVICYIGKQDDKDVIFFHKPMTPEIIIAISNILSKKKMRKALVKGNYKKAQKMAQEL